MKAFSPIFVFASVLSLLALVNCGGSSSTPEPLADQQFTKLYNTGKSWKITSATLDGNDKTSDYTAGVSGDAGPMTLTITGTKGTASSYAYSVSGRPQLSPWPKSGKWEFGTDPTTQIIRDKGTADELAVTYSVDGTSLQISFTFSNSNGGYTNPRVNVVSGSWVFKFTAQ